MSSCIPHVHDNHTHPTLLILSLALTFGRLYCLAPLDSNIDFRYICLQMLSYARRSYRAFSRTACAAT
jgi:hypothetical protein